MKKILLLLILIIGLSGCAYQKYHARQFEPPKSSTCQARQECYYDVNHQKMIGNYQKAMRQYYKRR